MEFRIYANADAAAFRFLRRNPESNFYAIFEVARRRHLRCWRSVSNISEDIHAILIEGSQPLRPYVPDSWLAATGAAPARALLDVREHLDVKGTISVSASLYREIFNKEPPLALKDIHYLLRPGDQRISSIGNRQDLCITRVNIGNLNYGDNESAFRNLIGDPHQLSEKEFFYGLFIDGILISILEAGIATPYAVAVQQMYTRPEMRQNGYASYLLASISKCITANRRTVSYLASAENSAAHRLVKSLGFKRYEDRVLI